MTDQEKIKALEEANAILSKALSNARGAFGTMYYGARTTDDRRAIVTDHFARGMCEDIDAANRKVGNILRAVAGLPATTTKTMW